MKNEYKDLKIDNSDTKNYLKIAEDHFKKELSKLSLEKNDWEETINKLNEESKKQFTEIENMENYRAYADKYKELVNILIVNTTFIKTINLH